MPRVKKDTQPVVKKKVEKVEKKQETQPIGTARKKKEPTTADALAEFKAELKKELYKEIREQVIAENKRLDHIEKTKDKVEATLSKTELVLAGPETFRFSGTKDGLNVTKGELVMQSFNKGGALGIGTQSPKAIGPGSVHIRSNYNSEASLPVDGKGTVRGLLIESDADDSNAFLFRGVSRKNRQ